MFASEVIVSSNSAIYFGIIAWAVTWHWGQDSDNETNNTEEVMKHTNIVLVGKYAKQTRTHTHKSTLLKI